MWRGRPGHSLTSTRSPSPPLPCSTAPLNGMRNITFLRQRVREFCLSPSLVRRARAPLLSRTCALSISLCLFLSITCPPPARFSSLPLSVTLIRIRTRPPRPTVAVMLDGLAHYPALDASGVTVWDACESSLCNAHVGMGMDLHHHGQSLPLPPSPPALLSHRVCLVRTSLIFFSSLFYVDVSSMIISL